jgi:hypothetical protein
MTSFLVINAATADIPETTGSGHSFGMPAIGQEISIMALAQQFYRQPAQTSALGPNSGAQMSTRIRNCYAKTPAHNRKSP